MGAVGTEAVGGGALCVVAQIRSAATIECVPSWNRYPGVSAQATAGVITPSILGKLADPKGRQLLAEVEVLLAEEEEWRIQEILRRRYPPDLCRAAVETVHLRHRAREKFPATADRMYFDREGLEMASRWELARYRASRFEGCDTVIDLCCGIGGDALALAHAAQRRVWALDVIKVRLHLARLNAEALDVGARIGLTQCDAVCLRPRADALFADPSRRRGGRRIRSPEAYEPSLSSLMALRSAVPALAVKVAPGIPEQDLPPDCEVEFVSSGGQCREAVLYFGPLARGRRRATLLPGDYTLEEPESPTTAPIAPPGRFLYDPDPAVVRAHLIDVLALRLGAWKLDARIAYLSADALVNTPFARSYRVLDHLPYHLRRVRQYLIGSRFWPEEIKKRRFPMQPDEFRRLLDMPPDIRRAPGTTTVTLVLTRIAERLTVLICQALAN
jgi:hypothetical protein